jgi:hypothetical protein
MERVWGARSGSESNALYYSAGTRAESENIAFNQIYIEYTSPIGLFKVGYMPDYVWGTAFGDQGSMLYDGQIQYFIQSGPFIGFLGYSKRFDNSYSAVNTYSIDAWRADRDYDSYRVAGIYEFKGNNLKGEAGLLFLYDRDATHRGSAGLMDTPPAGPFLTNVYVLDPYVKAKFGAVTLQAEAQYWFGDAVKWESTAFGSPLSSYTGGTAPPNVTINALSIFVDATVNLGPAYVGGTFVYLSGDKPDVKSASGTGSTVEGGINTGGADFNPCLMMFNTETMGYWAGPINGHTDSVLDAQMSNAWFGQLRVGAKPTPQWDIMLSLSYATADQKPVNPYADHPTHIYTSGDYGTEIDLTGTYKITNNLSYMLGVGYLFTGDYFKGINIAGEDYKIQDDYMLINKLTLNF